MSGKRASGMACGLLMLLALSSTGCGVTQGPQLGFLGFPFPISPYFQDKKEDEFWIKERYDRVPVLGPLAQGWKAACRCSTKFSAITCGS